MSRKPSNETLRFWAKMGCALLSVMLLTVWEHVQALRLERHVSALRKEADRLTYENGRLQNQVFQWTSPSHLDALARQQYGMAPPDSAHVIGIRPP